MDEEIIERKIIDLLEDIFKGKADLLEYTILLKKYNNQKGIEDETDASICALIEISSNIDISMYNAAEALNIPIEDMEQRLTRLVNADILNMENDRYYIKITSNESFQEKLKKALKYIEFDTYFDEFDKLIESEPKEGFSIGWRKLRPLLDTSQKEDKGLKLLISHLLQFGLKPLDLNMELAKFRTPILSLIKKGLAVIPSKDSGTFDFDEEQEMVLLAPEPCGILFKGDNGICSSITFGHVADYTQCSSIKERKLFFAPEMESQVSMVRRAFQRDSFSAIAKRLQDRKRPAGLACLFYGRPGTGKTELARQIARATGRNIVSVDTAKVTGSLCGESEKAARSIFLFYRYVFAISNNPPILLFNECDGILGQRQETTNSSAEREHNMVQSVFLDEMERFEGLLIATTNLPKGLDKAYDRRFQIKICFDTPSIESRRMIWHEEMPSMSEENLELLSANYPLSGGEIVNICTRCDIYEILEGTTIPVSMIKEYCEKELSFRNDSKRPITYQAPIPEKGKNNYS